MKTKFTYYLVSDKFSPDSDVKFSAVPWTGAA